MTDNKMYALSRIASLAALPHALLERMASAAGLQRIGKGSILFREGERAHFVYGLVEGTVALESGPAGEETIIDFLENGDILLVPPALLDVSYMVGARAVNDLVVVMFAAEEFRHFAETEIALSAALNRVLSAHWRLLLRHLTYAKTQDADTRLAQYLSNLSARDHGPAQLTLPGSKKDLAAHLGMTPATLSRSLKRLVNRGVHSNGADIDIDDVARLCESQAPSGQQAGSSARQ